MDSSGHNVSSSGHTLVATDVDGTKTPAANGSLGKTFGLIDVPFLWLPFYYYLLPTGSYTVGAHQLHFTVDGVAAPTIYTAPFTLRR